MSTHELVLLATEWVRLDCPAGHPGGTAMLQLHAQASDEILDAGRRLSGSAVLHERLCGVAILGEFGRTNVDPNPLERPRRDEAVSHLTGMLENHGDDARVIRAAVVAVGFWFDERALAPLLALANHPDPGVRYSVAGALVSSCIYEKVPDERLVGCLVELAGDTSPDVRYSAVFELAALVENGVESSTITHTLEEALTDPDPGVQRAAAEALPNG